jgi:hypothetical protein
MARACTESIFHRLPTSLIVTFVSRMMVVHWETLECVVAVDPELSPSKLRRRHHSTIIIGRIPNFIIVTLSHISNFKFPAKTISGIQDFRAAKFGSQHMCEREVETMFTMRKPMLLFCAQKLLSSKRPPMLKRFRSIHLKVRRSIIPLFRSLQRHILPSPVRLPSPSAQKQLLSQPAAPKRDSRVVSSFLPVFNEFCVEEAATVSALSDRTSHESDHLRRCQCLLSRLILDRKNFVFVIRFSCLKFGANRTGR